MSRYAVSAKGAATAATTDHALATLWNPATARRIKVREVWVSKTAAGGADEPTLRRCTARGTPGSTVTPTIVNDLDRDLAPASGALLDLAAYTVQPTLEAIALPGQVLPAAIGSSCMWVFGDDGLWIPAGNGLVVTQAATTLAFPISRVTFIFDDP